MSIQLTAAELRQQFPQLSDPKKHDYGSNPKADSKELLRTIWKLCTDAEFPFIPEVKFHAERNWRFDWGCGRLKLAVEIEGILHNGSGRHQRAKGLENDAEKYNSAAEFSWIVLRYTPNMLKSRPHEVVRQILAVAEICRKRFDPNGLLSR